MRARNVVDKGKCLLADFERRSFHRFSCRQTGDIGTLLDERRKALPEIDASIEKCLMINRLSTYVTEVIAE
jgi:hypothetical protein